MRECMLLLIQMVTWITPTGKCMCACACVNAFDLDNHMYDPQLSACAYVCVCVRARFDFDDYTQVILPSRCMCAFVLCARTYV